MTVRQPHLRSLAASDVNAALAHLQSEGGDSLALQFIDDLEQAFGQIRSSPLLGSTRFAYELAIPELRVWGLKKFPYLIFYLPSKDRIDVWRVLHSRRDRFVGHETVLAAFSHAPAVDAARFRIDLDRDLDQDIEPRA